MEALDFEIDWALILIHLGSMGLAYVLALPIAWDRESKERSAGLRTFPIVAVAVCGFSLLGIDVLEGSDAESRVIQGILAGIGFIGGGSILKNEDGVKGTATAASIWAVGAIGIAVAWQRIEIALVLSIITFFTLRVVGNWKEHMSLNEQGEERR